MNKSSYKSLYIKSCFNVGTKIFEGTVLSTATGFLIKSNNKFFLITNRHVVTGKNIFTGELLDKKNAALPNELIVEFSYEVKRKFSNDTYWGNPFKISLYKNGEINEKEKLWLEHPVYKDKVDIVAINVTEICKDSVNALYTVGNCSFAQIASYEIDSDTKYIPKVTDNVFVVGYPYGYSSTNKQELPIWTNATIASEYEMDLTLPLDYRNRWNELFNKMCSETDENKKIELRDELDNLTYEAPTFLIDARTRSGQSGSPVIINNEKDSVLLGVYSGRVSIDSDLGYVWKTELIKEIIEGEKKDDNNEI